MRNEKNGSMRSWVSPTGGAVLVGAILLAGGPVRGADLYSGDAWRINWDNTFSYGLGMRAQKIDPEIGNNPIFQNSEYKFPHVGSIVTSRLGLLTEFQITHGSEYGLRISADGWKDFAYDDHSVRTNPALAAFSSQPSGHYGSFTANYYDIGGELDDAFLFKNFRLGNTPVQIKAGRFTEFWGNAIFAGGQAISYSQSPIDIIKAVGSPGAELKELFMPRGQISVHTQISETLALGAQYAFEWRPNRLPEGGTYLGIVDPGYYGPQSLEGLFPRGKDSTPPQVHNNYGLSIKWSPNETIGTLGFYFRQFDDTSPYAPILLGLTPAGVDYHLAYARNVHLYGISLDREVGPVSLGAEASYRQGTGLYSHGLSPNDDGARGNTLNAVANGVYGLTPSRLYDTGTLIGELAYTRVIDVTANKSLYDAVGYAPCIGLGRTDGCSTRDNLSATLNVDPQWLQVFPGIDLDMPINVSVGIYGNGQYLGTAGSGNDQNTVAYTFGINANIRQRYSVKVAYNGYYAETGHLASANAGAGSYNPTGTGLYMWNDKGWLSLVLKASF